MKIERYNGFVPFTKAYTKEIDGKVNYYLEAKVSDDGVDLENDQMSLKALELMRDAALGKGVVKVRGLIENHRSTFAFAKILDAEIVKDESGLNSLIFVFELDEDFPYSKKLFKSVKEGLNEYQLSIGGYVDFKSKDAIKFIKDKTGKIIRQILKIILEHVAVTPFNQAANPRTSFISAVSKSIGEKEEVILEEKIDFSKYNLFKTIFKTRPDVYDGHFHVINPADIDENGNGMTLPALGIHTLAREHSHDVKDFLIKNTMIELENPSEEEMKAWNSEAGYDSPVSEGIFYSRHKSYDGPANMSVSKNNIDLLEKSYLERRELPDSAFAIKNLRMLPHHYKNVDDGNDSLTISIKMLKESLDYVQSNNFLLNFGLTEKEIKCYKEEATQHLLKHLKELELPKIGVFKRWSQRLLGGKTMSLKQFFETIDSLSKESEITDSNLEKFLGARNSLDSILKEHLPEVDKVQPVQQEQNNNANVDDKKDNLNDEVMKSLNTLVSKLEENTDKFKVLEKGISELQQEQAKLKLELEKSNSNTPNSNVSNVDESDDDSEADEFEKDLEDFSTESLMKRLKSL